MANYLKINYQPEADETELNLLKVDDEYRFRYKPLAVSPVYEAKIDSFERLTRGQGVKTVYKLTFQQNKEIPHNFLPGDAIAILPENDQTEIDELFKRLNLEEICNKNCQISLAENSGKKNIPKHLPTHQTTLNQIFLKYICIRSVPKKLFLKALIKHTSQPADIEKLQQVCSASGSSYYLKFIEENRTLLSLLNALPSCNPPVELILEHSTPLNPRYYSITTSPFNQRLSIIFYILELRGGLKGVCSGWLEKIIKDNDMSKIIPVYFRKPTDFRLKIFDKHLMLVATGTGLAPFMGFLDHFKHLEVHPEIWLFYGCRYSMRDFICKNCIQSYADGGILKCLFTSFSKEKGKQYVQHKMLKNKEAVVDFVLNKDVVIYVCGDPKTMVKDVKDTMVNCFMECKNLDRINAEGVLSDLVQKGRFIVDGWA